MGINNSTVLSTLYPTKLNDWTPVTSFVYDATAKTIVIEDGSTLVSGDTYKQTKVIVTDGSNKTIAGTITATGHGNAITISTASLDPSQGYSISAAVQTATREACGQIVGVGIYTTAASLGSYDFSIIQ